MDEGEYEEFELGLGLDNLMDGRDYLYRLVNSIDGEAQLDAIKAVLRRNEDTSLAFSAHIVDLAEHAENYTGPYHYHVVDNSRAMRFPYRRPCAWRRKVAQWRTDLPRLGMPSRSSKKPSIFWPAFPQKTASSSSSI